jgi:starch synthase
MMFVMIHRITEQKGFQLVLNASEGIFKTLGCQAIIGGAVSSGDDKGEEIAHGLWLLGQYYAKNASVSIGFQEVSVPLLSADVFLMPSAHEPGGISQIEAFMCGMLVLARATGGLRDTVFPVRRTDDGVDGNGFLFTDFTPASFYDALERAQKFFSTADDETLYAARMNAERSVYYWDRPAAEYLAMVYDHKEIIRPDRS